MDKQKQIEEIENVICSETYGEYCKCCNLKGYCTECERVATALYNAGYRKIPEGVVVLTREEYSDYLVMKDAHQNAIERCEKLQADNERLYKNIGKFKDAVRKETAEKFAERLKEKLEDCSPIDGYDLEDLEFDGETIQECIDEICEEITEGE